MRRIVATVVVVLLACPAWATHNHPSKAKQLKLSFVTAYNQCAAPTLTHRPALALPACAPVPSTSNNPTNSVSFGPAGSMTAKIKISNGDIKVKVSGSGIENNSAPFTGTLTLYANVRMSDHGCSPINSPPFTTPCTVVDFPFPVPVQCTAGTCAANTSLNQVVPTAVHAGDELNVEFGQAVILDPDNDHAFRQGLFVP